MGVFSVFKRFILILYSLTLSFIVLINLFSFSGIDLFSSGPFNYINGGNTFENSYFGFASIINAIDDFPVPNLYNMMVKIISVLIDSLSGGANRIAVVLNTTQGFDWSEVIAVLTGIAEIIVAPIYVLLALLAFAVGLLDVIWNVIAWFTMLIGGYYNIPLRTM